LCGFACKSLWFQFNYPFFGVRPRFSHENGLANAKRTNNKVTTVPAKVFIVTISFRCNHVAASLLRRWKLRVLQSRLAYGEVSDDVLRSTAKQQEALMEVDRRLRQFMIRLSLRDLLFHPSELGRPDGPDSNTQSPFWRHQQCPNCTHNHFTGKTHHALSLAIVSIESLVAGPSSFSVFFAYFG